MPETVIISKTKLEDLANRLRAERISADVSHPINPKICQEAAEFLEEILKVLKSSDVRVRK